MMTQEQTAPYLSAYVIDGNPELLDASYRLRYQVYCLERKFLPAADYPDGREIDRYDSHSVHLAVVNRQGEIAATARLIELGDSGLPLLEHCRMFSPGFVVDGSRHRVVEVSRLAVSRNYNRRVGDAHYALAGATYGADPRERRSSGRGGLIIMTLCKALYQASKRAGYTTWLAATEASLQRLISAYGLPFRPIGPETDYYGPVTPYAMDVAEFDQIISSGRVPYLRDFREGLEPAYLGLHGV